MAQAVNTDSTSASTGQTSAPILGLAADAGITAIGTGSAVIQVTTSPSASITAGTATWFTIAQLTTTTLLTPLGYVVSGLRVVSSNGNWTVYISQDVT